MLLSEHLFDSTIDFIMVRSKSEVSPAKVIEVDPSLRRENLFYDYDYYEISHKREAY